jgi:hypothetical protein
VCRCFFAGWKAGEKAAIPKAAWEEKIASLENADGSGNETGIDAVLKAARFC